VEAETTPVDVEEPVVGTVTETVPELPEPIMPRLTYDSSWGRSGILNYLMIGTSMVIAGLNMGIGPRYDNPTQGGILFDEDARDTLRLHDEHDRVIARDISDVFLTILTSYPTVVDALLVAAWMHDSSDVAVQMILMHAEVVTFLLALHTTSNVVMSRERPYGRTCEPEGDELPDDSGLCDSPGRYYSWFSGHASQSFANAALICMNHAYLDLYGGGAADLAPCLVGLALAGATAVLRIMGDMHYATDVITGAIVGTGVGVLLPYLLHYGHDDPPLTVESDDVSVTILPTPVGASIFGSF
jgi:membrane-associated phospholipid phosphatase